MLGEDHCLPVNVKFVSGVKYSLINSRNWIHAISDVNLHENVAPVSAEN